MFDTKKFNEINDFNNENSNNNSSINWKKRKRNFNKSLTIQNKNFLSKQNGIFSLSYEAFNESERECVMKKNCPYHKSYIELKNKTKEYIFSIKKIKALNEILYNSLERQNKIYKSLINENKILKEELFNISSKKKYLYTNKNERKISVEKNANKNKNLINIRKYIDKEIKSLSEFNLKNIFDLKENSEEFKDILKTNKKIYFNKNKSKNNIKEQLNKKELSLSKSQSERSSKHNNLKNNKSPLNHYDTIKDYITQKNLNLFQDKMKCSILFENIDYEVLIRNNKVLNELISLTQSEDYFASKLKDAPYDIYYKYYNIISLLIKDFKDYIKLCSRLKDFIAFILILTENLNDIKNTIKILIKNTCSVLSCEKVNLFLLDNISDSLILYSKETLENHKKRISKNSGIIGKCFSENKKIRIDNAENSFLCHPLIDKNGQTFGVIQAINKLNAFFNEDDEELIKLLSKLISYILINMKENEDNRNFINKFNIIINYSINLMNMKSKFEFTEKNESTLLNLFNCSISKFYFVENNKIIYYNNLSKEKQEFDINMGIIGKVIKNKNIYALQNIIKCPEYNSIVDIDTMEGVLTIPILESNTKKIKGVAQIPYIGTVYKNNKPKDIECKIIKIYRKYCKNWMHYLGF